jgi:hypothetical protein
MPPRCPDQLHCRLLAFRLPYRLQVTFLIAVG